MRKFLYLFLSLALLISCSGPKCPDGEYTLHLYTTNDVHGRYFDSLYVSNKTKPSLLAVNHIIDSVRNAVGQENVILVDAGDCLQGDNAAYYFNYVDTQTKHLYARMVEYMKYDAIAVGNHDIETRHPVYDRIVKEMKVPFLAANARRVSNSLPYFQEYVMLDKNGLKVAVIGFTNPNIKAWLAPSIWSGIEFKSLLPFVQETVDRVQKKEKPDVTVVLVHSGTGKGDGSIYESQGLDLYNSLEGVDFLVCSHDHSPYIASKDGIALINSGSHCRNVGHGVITVQVKDGKVVSRKISAENVPVNKNLVDRQMGEYFRADYEAVKTFTKKEIGTLETELRTRDSYMGMCDYMNLIHTLSLSCTPAQLSMAAPLTFDGIVKPGTLLYNDLFTIYPFENQLFVVKLSGQEVKDYLEYSYDNWINSIKTSDEHLLKISQRPDYRTGVMGWSFVNRAYNFDSCGGLVYDVDVTRPKGERISIKSMADGSSFSLDDTYNVAMTSYRASGGGKIMSDGAGVCTDNIAERVVAYHKEIRNILYDYLMEHGTINSSVIGNPAVIGHWDFVPSELARPAIERDMNLVFK